MKRLEEIARAATPGPWIRCGTDGNPIPVVTTKAKSGYQLHSMLHVKQKSPDVYDGMRETYNRDAAFIAAANPAAILALIQRVRDAEAAADSAIGDMSADLRDAERRGVEEEREACAQEVESAEAKTPWMRVGLAIVARRIRQRPLLGDAS